VLIAQAVFLLERGQTDETERPTHDGGYAGMGNKEGPKLNSRENVDCVYDKMWTASGSTVNDLDSDGANVRLLILLPYDIDLCIIFVMHVLDAYT